MSKNRSINVGPWTRENGIQCHGLRFSGGCFRRKIMGRKMVRSRRRVGLKGVVNGFGPSREPKSKLWLWPSKCRDGRMSSPIEYMRPSREHEMVVVEQELGCEGRGQGERIKAGAKRLNPERGRWEEQGQCRLERMACLVFVVSRVQNPKGNRKYHGFVT